MQNFYEAVDSNKRKSLIIVIGFALFIFVVVYVISQAMSYYFGYQAGGLGIFGVAMIASGLISLGSYYYSDKIVLTLSGARPADRKRDFEYYTVVENLCIATGLPKPKLYVINDSAPNAFATGRDPKHAAICTTTGLLDKLNRTELEGVIGHELSHIRNYDTRLMAVVAVMVGVVALIGDWFLRMSFWGGRRRNDREEGQLGVIIIVVGFIFAILSPIIGQLIQLAISRRREFLADASSVEITHQPNGLISALKKISSDNEPLEAANKATAHLYIVNPFKEKGHGAVGWFANLFNTHPPIPDRIKALEKVA
ncbi:M48 family metallopeptidase [Candidatus Woesebacteria bacterium]|nr:M48 family metallopeptidase [Candidatus Woesebacteria bacterium]QQG47158.1 MAG: M48 family metallopeptidase [Candidatus Woesebacteria bacterium]